MVTKEDNNTMSAEETKDKQPVEPPAQFTLEIVRVIREWQAQHGLRHGDYQRYRGYCSRRARRLRKALRLPQGDRRHFKRRDVTAAHVQAATGAGSGADGRLLHVPLVLAERCWAYAMQLRQESNTEPRKRFHLVQRLRKACGYAQQLQELCELDRCDARTKLEAQAYVAWMQGSLQFELQLWRRASENLQTARVIYERLAGALPEEERAPYAQRADEIAPSLRYCAYNIGDDQAVDLLELRSAGVLENFEALVSQTKERQAAVLHEVQWFGVKVPVRIERVRLFLLSIEGLDESLRHAEDAQAKIKILEDLFIDLRDVISLAREGARADKQDQLLLSYLISIRVERTAHRNLLLVTQARKPQDCVRLLDITVQQTLELSQNEAVREDEAAVKAYGAHLQAYRALRTYYLARTQANQKKWREAAALFDVCDGLIRQVPQHKFIDELEGLLKNARESVEVDRANAQANFVLDQQEDPTSLPVPQKVYKTKKPLSERLDEFREEPHLLSKNPNIVTLPPAMEPVPAKPIFFDLALNFVEFPDLQDKLEAGQPKQKQGAGISGFVKGLWGWGKK